MEVTVNHTNGSFKALFLDNVILQAVLNSSQKVPKTRELSLVLKNRASRFEMIKYYKRHANWLPNIPQKIMQNKEFWPKTIMIQLRILRILDTMSRNSDTYDIACSIPQGKRLQKIQISIP